MAINYGISHCERVIAALEAMENKMFEEAGFGFSFQSEEHVNLIRYKAYLKKFKLERSFGKTPSYDPSIHGNTTGE